MALNGLRHMGRIAIPVGAGSSFYDASAMLVYKIGQAEGSKITLHTLMVSFV